MLIAVENGKGITTKQRPASIEETRRNEGSLSKHKIDSKNSEDLLLLMNCSMRPNLPTRSQILKRWDLLFLGDMEMSTFKGEALILQSCETEVWQKPKDGTILEGGIIPLKQCQKATGLNCIYKILRRHFERQFLHDWGWRALKNEKGQIIALSIIR